MICGRMSSAIASAHARLMSSNDNSCRSLMFAGLEKCRARASSHWSLRRDRLAASFSAEIRSRVWKTCASMIQWLLFSLALGLCPEAANGQQPLLAVGGEGPEQDD